MLGVNVVLQGDATMMTDKTDDGMHYTSFDLASIERHKFEELLNFYNLEDYFMVEVEDGHYHYVWTDAERSMAIITACNLVTGQFASGKKQIDRKDYASYVCVAAWSEDMVRRLADGLDYKADNVKGRGLGFMGVRDNVAVRLGWSG